MTTISKDSKEYILQLVKENSIKRIISYCDGLGFDTNKYSSPVHYGNGKLSIRYRGISTYYYL